MWRNTCLKPKFFMLDGVSIIPTALFLFHISNVTFCILCITLLVLELLRRRGIDAVVMFRILRRCIGGNYRRTENSIRLYRSRMRW